MQRGTRTRFTEQCGIGALVLSVQFLAHLPSCAGSKPLEVMETSCGKGLCARNVVSPLGDGGVCIAGEGHLRVIRCDERGDTELASIDLGPEEVSRTESPIVCSASTCYFAECDRVVTLHSFPRAGGSIQSQSLNLRGCSSNVPLVYATDDDTAVLVVAADGIVNVRAPEIRFEVPEEWIGTLQRICVQGGSVAYASKYGQSVVVSDIRTGRIEVMRELGWHVTGLACVGDGVVAVVRTYSEEETAVEFLSNETLDTVAIGPSLSADGSWMAVSIGAGVLTFDTSGRNPMKVVDLLQSEVQVLPGKKQAELCIGDSEAKAAQAMCYAGGSWYLLRPARPD